MSKYWNDSPCTKGKKKQRMVKYYCFIWTQGPFIKPLVFWPKFGFDENWVCQLLIEHVRTRAQSLKRRWNMPFVGDKVL
jgi:hypothetical protein